MILLNTGCASSKATNTRDNAIQTLTGKRRVSLERTEWRETKGMRCWGIHREVERVMGIEPTLEAWEAAVLPLNYTRRTMLLMKPHYSQ